MPDNEKLIELIKTAKRTLKNSHSPHSKFKVGAAVLTKGGKIFNGTNVEFDAFSLTVCAERSALFNAISNGDKNIVIIAIATSSREFKFPCGLCRQALIEFNPAMQVILINRSGKTKKFILRDILPKHFRL
jgi:cytidine deaminase